MPLLGEQGGWRSEAGCVGGRLTCALSAMVPSDCWMGIHTWIRAPPPAALRESAPLLSAPALPTPLLVPSCSVRPWMARDRRVLTSITARTGALSPSAVLARTVIEWGFWHTVCCRAASGRPLMACTA
jgi:hypothetical protein